MPGRGDWTSVALKRVAGGEGALFVDGDWIEAPYITDAGIRLIQTGNIGVGTYKEQGYRYVSEETFRALRCREVLPGDVLICRLADPVGRACIAPNLGVRMITSVDNCIVRPNGKQWSARFLNYALSSADYLQQLESMSRGGTRDRVSRSMLGDVKIRRPPMAEQERIANFLDEQTARIDALIAEKERLLENLAELRLSTISVTVGGGFPPAIAPQAEISRLYPNPPRGWTVTRLGFLASKIGSGKTPSGGAEVYVSAGIPLIRSMNVYDDGMHMDDVAYITPEMDAELSATRLKVNDILLNITGASIGRTCVVPEDVLPANINQHTCIVRLFEPRLVPYVSFAMKSAQTKAQIDAFQNGAAREGLNFSQVAQISVLLPDKVEVAQALAAELEARLGSIDGVSQHTARHIDRLREYRSSLISSAVTGQLNVDAFEARQLEAV